MFRTLIIAKNFIKNTKNFKQISKVILTKSQMTIISDNQHFSKKGLYQILMYITIFVFARRKVLEF